MTTFDELIDKINNTITEQRDRGTAFEKMVVAYLRYEPAFKKLYSDVWMLKDVPEEYGIPKKDTGVDIVARKYDGDLTAVQAKFYKGEIGKPTINSFIAEASKNYYSDGMIVSTTDNWGINAEEALEDTNIQRRGLSDLRKANVDWGKFNFNEEIDISKKTVKKLRGYQKKAIDKAVKYFKSDEKFHDRGQLIMAPGTGKTFTSLKIAEALMNDQKKNQFNILYLVPSIQLLSQTLFNWNDDVSEDIDMTSFSVVSDRKATRRQKNSDLDIGVKDIGFPATTDVKKLMHNYNNLKETDNKQLIVVFSTYQSIDVIHQAQENGYPEFDLIIADEAHRTTGAAKLNEDSTFTKVHYNENVKSKLRLYQTATPKIYDKGVKRKAEENSIVVSSMDNLDKYGHEIYRLSFGEAVAQGYLTDYKVSVLSVDNTFIDEDMQKVMSKDNQLETDEIGQIIGVWNAMVKRDGTTGSIHGKPMKRAIAFTSSIADSKAITSEFQTVVNSYLDVQSSGSYVVDAQHADGTLNALQKKNKIDWLADDNIEENHARLLSNVKFLTEGIDVPNLDAIIFFKPKSSQVDIVQAVGRVMRRAKGKEYGYIIIPIVVPEGVEPNLALDNNENFKDVWKILNALRSTDERFYAEVNQIALNKKDPDRIGVNQVHNRPNRQINENTYKTNNEPQQLELPLEWKTMQKAFYGKLLKKVGTRNYLDGWSKNVANIAKRHISKINNLINSNDGAKMAFDNFLKSLRFNINNSINKEKAIEMLAQHLITEPIFDALFNDNSFVKNNAVSKAMNKVVDKFKSFGFYKDQDELKKFYQEIQTDAKGIDNAEGKQRLIATLYEKFFANGFSKTTEQLGIVFTPTEIVDFIIKSVDEALNKYFGKKLINDNVHILDPFTGTGTFVTRTLHYFKKQLDDGTITYDDILRKYMHELHANEIVLLSYYIAAVNIESTFEGINKEYSNEDNDYKPFEGIVLTDTFASNESKDSLDDELFGENDKRLSKEQGSNITAIYSNPPYSVGQRSANDNNENNKYPDLKERIDKTYGSVKSTQKKGLYDSYIQAFRWCTDKIGQEGVIGFITNSGYIDNKSAAGFRKSLYKEFNHIYIYDLLGSINGKSKKEQKRQGDNVFDIKVGVAIIILVKDGTSTHEIKYQEIGNNLSRDEKLSKISKIGNIFNLEHLTKIVPDKYEDWINQRNSSYQEYSTVFAKTDSVFKSKITGISTNKDSWVYNFNDRRIRENVNLLFETYNSEMNRLRDVTDPKKRKNEVTHDPKKIKWSDGLLNKKFVKGKQLHDNGRMITVLYRPFVKKRLYYSRGSVLDRPGLFDEKWGDHNISMLLSTGGNKNGGSALATDIYSDLHTSASGTNVFTMYYNDENNDINLLKDDKYNITDSFKDKINLSKEDIFYYVYAIMHSKEYLSIYNDDLCKGLPHIPIVKNKDKYVEIGKKLFNLHLNYESVPQYDGVSIETNTDNVSYKVKKMRFPKSKGKYDKTKIIFNDDITISNIPLETYNYTINGRSAIEWLMSEYQYTEFDSGIIDDPNEFSDDPKYIFNLLLSVINVSLKTVELSNQLPKFEIIDDDK